MTNEAPLSIPTIAVFDAATGTLAYLAPGAPALPASMSWARLPTGYSDETHSWSAATRMMVEDVAKVRQKVLTAVKADAEQRKMLFLSPGGAKKAEYADKAREVAFWDSLGGTVSAALVALNLLSADARAAKFSYAIAEAAALGEPTIAPAIARFRLGMTGANKVPAIAAAEAKACAAIKAATTPTTIRSTAAGIVWP